MDYTHDYLDQMKWKVDPDEIPMLKEEVDNIIRMEISRRKEMIGNREMIIKDTRRRETQDDKPRMVQVSSQSKTSNSKDINRNANKQRLGKKKVNKKSIT